MHEHGVTLGDPVDGARADRGVPRRDRQGRRRLPASGTESRSSVTSSPDGIRRWTGSAAIVPASTATLTKPSQTESWVDAAARGPVSRIRSDYSQRYRPVFGARSLLVPTART